MRTLQKQTAITLALLFLISCFSTCKKDKDDTEQNHQRISEILYKSSGIDRYKDVFEYTNGKISLWYSYEYNEKGDWEYSHKNELEYNSSSFTERSYDWENNSWHPV